MKKLKGYKIKIGSVNESKTVQKKCFGMGYFWPSAMGKTDTLFETSPYLFIKNEKSKKYIKHSISEIVFNDSIAPEITAKEFLNLEQI